MKRKEVTKEKNSGVVKKKVKQKEMNQQTAADHHSGSAHNKDPQNNGSTKNENSKTISDGEINSTPSGGAISTLPWEELAIDKAITAAVKSIGWTKPTEIQSQSIPHALEGRDIIGLAQTGSGKTGAFAIPIIQKLMDQPSSLACLVIAPTRELAIQISESFEAIGNTFGLSTCVIVGGVPVMDQAIALAKQPHVIICTPGRINYHLNSTKGFSLRNLRFLVLDEADKLLNMDFEEEIVSILKAIPRKRQTFLFSATMTTKVNKLQQASLSDPVMVTASPGKYATVDTLSQHYIFIPAVKKEHHLVYILNELAGNTTIVFTSACQTTLRLAILLRSLGFEAVPLSGKLTQSKRISALNSFKGGSKNILIATDVASRGLDIPSVDIVINYDVPTHPKDYVHRVGRTARAGRGGRAITIVTQYDVEAFQKIEDLIGIKMEAFPVEERAVEMLTERVVDAQRITQIELKDMQHNRKKDNFDSDDDTEERSNQGGYKKRKQYQQKKRKQT